MTNWKKKGLLYSPSRSLSWDLTHAAVPTPLLIDSETLRIYFTSRDVCNIGRVSFIDVDPGNPQKIIRNYNNISLDVSEYGFDDCGVQCTQVLKINDKYHMFFMGFQRTERHPYYIFTGHAISENGEKFIKTSVVPVMDRTQTEPTIRAMLCVDFIENNKYRYFYLADKEWTKTTYGKKIPVNVLMSGITTDNFDFNKSEIVLTPKYDSGEVGFGRPWVNNNDIYFSVRKIVNGKSEYTHIEKALIVGKNKINRTGEIVLTRSPGEFDEKMCCFPAIIDLPDGKYCFYNGNGYGEAGFGLAKKEMK